MKNKFLFMAALSLAAVAAQAETLTPLQALDRLNGDGAARMRIKSTISHQPVYTEKSDDGKAAAYIFNAADKGYLIVSADDAAMPLLGYSDTGMIDPANMSPEMKWWLSEYARQIQWASERGIKYSAPQETEALAPIAPLVKTKWDQGTPYNDMCPEQDGRHAYSGCVATSMAQVMNYHEWPEKGKGSKAYSCPPFGRLYMSFSRTEFDWDNMLDFYNSGKYNKEQGDAVALLMKACGYSVEMGYGFDASGASGYTIASSLVEYFDYDPNCRSVRRDPYSSEQWMQLIYDNLSDCGPVIINGQSPLEGGHSFVCDGYDGNGMFHFNWGWSGMSDGYYALSALNPEAQGIGGFAGGFNFSQNAIIGIKPNAGGTAETLPEVAFQYGTTSGSISGKTVTFTATKYDIPGWASGIDKSISVTFGVIIEPAGSTGGAFHAGMFSGHESITLPGNGSFLPSPGNKITVDLTSANLADGDYRLVVATRNAADATAPVNPILVPWGMNNYVNLKVQNGVFTVTDVEPALFNIDNMELLTKLYNNRYALLKVHISNENDIEVTQGLCPKLFKNGREVFTGESVLLSLKPGEEIDYEWPVKFLPLNGAPTINGDTPMVMKIANPVSDEFYEGISLDVVMSQTPAAASFYINESMFDDAYVTNWEYHGQNVPRANILKDGDDQTYRFKVNVSRGYLDGEIRVGIFTPETDDDINTLVPVEDNVFNTLVFLDGGETESFEVPVNLATFEPSKLYYMIISYQGRTRSKTPFFYGMVGIDDVEVDCADAAPEYYNMQGMRITAPEAGQMVIVKKGAKTVKKIWK